MQVSMMVTHPRSAPTAASEKPASAAARVQIADEPKADVAAAASAATRWDEQVARQLQQVVREADPTLPPLVRAELTLDDRTSRVVVRVVDVGKDQVVRQYPAEETLRLLARVREQLGALLRASV